MIGSRLAHYEITAHIGSGGMGDVFQATDTKLSRSVAIKFLPEAFASDSERVARFQREARVLASLNHPNIAAIYGLEESGGRSFLVMELVPGETLAERIARGGIAVEEALRIAIQIAEALETAHEKGITHRDLKPANIKLTDSGTVKVLDFGLAKVTASADSALASESPTLSVAATQAGVILGTAAYMSPEQARGKAVDKRADVWAFGVVLYELLTGQMLFGGEDVSETLARVIRDEPRLEAIPSQVRPLLQRCLEKDPRKRQRDIGDVRNELEQTLAARRTTLRTTAATVHEIPNSARLSRIAVLAAVFLVVGAISGIGLWRVAGTDSNTTVRSFGDVVRLSVAIPASIRPGQTSFAGDADTLVMWGNVKTPDGAEEQRGRIYTRRLNEYAFKTIPGTEGAQSFRTSPDGQWLAFIAPISEQSSQLQLKKVRLDGSSPPTVVRDWEEQWSQAFVWLEDGDLLTSVVGTQKFFRLPNHDGPPTSQIPIDTGSVAGIAILGNRLPGDRGVFFSMDAWGPRGYQLDQWLFDPKTGKGKRLFENAGSATYSPTGHILFTRGESLMAAPFDLEKLAVSGEVTALTDGVRTTGTGNHGDFEISSDGRLLYPPGGLLGTDRRLVIVDSSGKTTPFTSERRDFEGARISPDGLRAAVVLPAPKGTYEIWVADLDRSGLKRVAAVPNADCFYAQWSPKGERIAYWRQRRDKDDGIYVQRVDAAGVAPQLVLKSESPGVFLVPRSWTPNGSGLVISRIVNGQGDILFVSVPSDGKPATTRVLRGTPYNEGDAQLSPDGRLVAFTSNESGNYEIYVAPYLPEGTLGQPLMVPGGANAQISPGASLAWSGDSRRLFYDSIPYKVMSVTIETKPSLSASSPVVVLDMNKLRGTEWDVLPDGRLLVVQRGEGEDNITQYDIVLNWFSELRERMKAAGSGSKR